MELILVIMIALNMVQVNKDAARCKKSDFKESGCTVYVKAGLNKVK
jgi:hypothetical protein